MVRFFSLFVMFFLPFQTMAAPSRLTLDFTPPPAEFYLGQEVFFHIKLLDRIGLKDIGIVNEDWPNVDIFLDRSVSDETAEKDGISYHIRSLQFSLVAKSVGKMSLQPFCLQAAAPSIISTRDLSPEVKILRQQKLLEICTPPFSFEVKALPKHQPPLFAAAAVELFEGVVPKTPEIQAGMPIKRSLVLTAQGTLPAYLPDFTMPSLKNVKIYDGKTERTMVVKEKLISAVRKTIVFIPEKAGTLVLPEMKVTWLNVTTGKIETSVIPAYAVKVLSNTSTQEQADLRSPEKEETPQVLKKISVRQIAISFLVIALILIAVLPLLKKRYRRSRLIKRVEQACLSDQPEEIAAALIAWGKAVFPKQTVLSLADLRSLYQDLSPEFVAALQELELYLYGTGRFAKHLPIRGAKETPGKIVCRTFLSVLPLKIKPSTRKKDDLPGLYPGD